MVKKIVFELSCVSLVPSNSLSHCLTTVLRNNFIFLEIYKSAEEFLESTLSNNNGTNHPGYVAQPPMVSNPIINLEIMLLVLIPQLIVHVYVNSQTETIN